MALLKGKHSLLRYLGFIGAILAAFQALIWIGMYLSGIICFYIKCGSRQPANRFGKAFNNIYLNTKLAKHYPHIVTPIFFHVLLWFCMVLSALWLFASVSLIVDYRKWTHAKRLRKSSKRWIVMTVVVCALDLLLFVLFVVDFGMLQTGHIGASVRSTDDLEYDEMENDIEPYQAHVFDEFYADDDTSDLVTIENTTPPGTSELPTEEPVPASEAPSAPGLSFEERLRRIEANLAKAHAEVDKNLKEILAKAKLILETELGTHYNPLVRAKVAELMKQVIDMERLRAEDELNKQKLLAAKKKAEEEKQRTTTTKDGVIKTEAAVNGTEASTAESKVDQREVTPARRASPDKEDFERSSKGNFEERPSKTPQAIDNATEFGDPAEESGSTVKTGRNFDQFLRKLEETMKDIGDRRDETNNLGDSVTNRVNSNVNARLFSDEYNDMWRATFQDSDYGIILKNDGPGTVWRKITPMHEGSTSGADVVLAPSAVLMTLAIRGYVLWIVNLTSALMLLYLYITRPRRPTLITRIQA